MGSENIKILVFSDSHGNGEYIHRAISMHPDAEYVVHLGDGASDLTLRYPDDPEVRLITLEGNCDYLGFFAADRRFRPKPTVSADIGGVRFFMTHGHKYDVKYGLEKGALAAYADGADVFLFGHTHKALHSYLPEGSELPYFGVTERRLLLFNPGSIGEREHSFGVITVKDSQVLASHGRIV